MITHLLVDFGEVISHPQPPAAMRAMAELLDVPAKAFAHRYWGSRESYDRGLPAHDYWQLVAGRPVRGEELQLLRRLDIESWTHLNFATVTALRDARRRGAQLTLLSNAPNDLAAEIRGSAVLRDLFPLMVFSAELRLAKPDAEIFDAALALAEAEPEGTLFIDDRAENLEAARRGRIRTHRFCGSAALRDELAVLDFGASRGRSPWWVRVRSAATALRATG